MKRFHLVIMMLLAMFLWGGSAEAVGRGKPLVSTPLRDGADLAMRIRSNANGAEGTYLTAFQQVRSDIPLSGVEDMAHYVETLAPCMAPNGEYTVSRLLNGAVSTRIRQAVGERALCDPSGDGMPVIFLHCGNVVRKQKTESVVVAQGGSPGFHPLQSDVNWDRAFEDIPDESGPGQWHRTGRAFIYGASGVAASFVAPGTRIKQTLSSNSGSASANADADSNSNASNRTNLSNTNTNTNTNRNSTDVGVNTNVGVRVQNPPPVQVPGPPAPDPIGGPGPPAPDEFPSAGNDQGGPAGPNGDNW